MRSERGHRATHTLSKFARRHRVVIAASALFGAGLVGMTVAATWGMLRARAERTRAESALAESGEMLTFMNSLFADADPEIHGRMLGADELLEGGAERIASGEFASPMTRAKLQAQIGESLFALGRAAPAVDLLQAAYDSLRASPGPASTEAIGAGHNLARAASELRQFDRAEPRNSPSSTHSAGCIGARTDSRAPDKLSRPEEAAEWRRRARSEQ